MFTNNKLAKSVKLACAFGAASASPVAPRSIIDDPYSQFAPKEEDLPQEALDAFSANTFTWGEIPVLEPPISVR